MKTKTGSVQGVGITTTTRRQTAPREMRSAQSVRKRATLQKSADGTATHIKYRKMKMTWKVNSPTVTTNTYTKFSPSWTAKREASDGKRL